MRKARFWLLLSVAIVIVDQLTKQWASSELLVFQSVAIFPGFNLTLLHNTGAAFSILSDAGGMQRWFFIVVTFIVVGFILFEILRNTIKTKTEIAGLSLVLGGAIGNLIDRVVSGYVVDFLDFYIGDAHWPAFNVADSAIVIGVALLLYNYVYLNKSD